MRRVLSQIAPDVSQINFSIVPSNFVFLVLLLDINFKNRRKSDATWNFSVNEIC